MVIFAAGLLAVLGVVGLSLYLSQSAADLNRFGLLLQIAAVLSLLPHVVGKHYFRRLGLALKRLADPAAPIESGAIPNTGENAMTMDENFVFYRTHNLPVMLGNLFAALILMGLFAAFLILRQPSRLPQEEFIRAMLAFLGFAWLNLLMLIHIFRMMKVPSPPGVLAWFFSFDLVLSLVGLLLAGIVYICVNWLGRSLNYVFSNGLRRVLLMVTLPTVLAGILFEILATFV